MIPERIIFVSRGITVQVHAQKSQNVITVSCISECFIYFIYYDTDIGKIIVACNKYYLMQPFRRSHTRKFRRLQYGTEHFCVHIGIVVHFQDPICRVADKTLVRPGRKQANVSVRMVLNFLRRLALQGKRNLMTARVSMLLKSRASLARFRACFLPGRAKDLSAPQYNAVCILCRKKSLRTAGKCPRIILKSIHSRRVS